MQTESEYATNMGDMQSWVKIVDISLGFAMKTFYFAIILWFVFSSLPVKLDYANADFQGVLAKITVVLLFFVLWTFIIAGLIFALRVFVALL